MSQSIESNGTKIKPRHGGCVKHIGAHGMGVLVAVLAGCTSHSTTRNTTYEAAPTETAAPAQPAAEAPVSEDETEAPEAAAAKAPDPKVNEADKAKEDENGKVVVAEIAEVKAKLPVMGMEVTEGKPKESAKAKGKQTGIWVWQKGGNWNVVTTSADKTVFMGRVTSAKGLKNIKPTKNDLKDRMMPTKNEKGFSFALRTTSGMDGFRFKSEKDACVRFQLRVGGVKKIRESVYLGKDGVNPPGRNFRVCPDNAEDLQPEVKEIPESKGAVAKVDIAKLKGIPKGVKTQRGKEVAYWIGMQGKTRGFIGTTSDGLMHEFEGRVVGKQAPLTKVRTKKKEMSDRVIGTKNSNGFVFRFRTGSGLDGISFDTKGNDCIRMHLKIDGKPATKAQVHLGKDGVEAPGGLLKICAPEKPKKGDKPGKGNAKAAGKPEKPGKGNAKAAGKPEKPGKGKNPKK